MNVKTLSLMGSAVFLLLVIGGFFWLMNITRTPQQSAVPVAQTAGLKGLEKEVRSILSGLENHAGIPIGVPLEKMGRDNPFAGI